MKATLTFLIETTNPQKAASVRDRTAEWLNSDDDVQVVDQSMSQVQDRWKVKGADITTKEPFEEIVEADDAEAAKAKVESAKKVVVTVEAA